METGGSVMSVREALAAMQQCVCHGDMATAREIGASAAVPLSISAAELCLGDKISEGSESVVFSGTYKGQPVAVKKLRLSTSADLDRFRSELILLSNLDHANVITLVGAKALPPDYMIVLQLAQYNLAHMMYELAWRPTWDVIIRIGMELADALAAMHAMGVVHRDIKPANLLLSQDSHKVLLSDFGIAVPVSLAANATEDTGKAAPMRGTVGRPTGGFHKQRMMGTLQYMAPEVLHKEPTSLASDAYAFAVTLNELATGVVPFSDCTKDNPEVHTVLEMGYGRQELAVAVAAEGLRPLLPRHRPPGYEELLAACWMREPKGRPSMVEIREKLATIAAALPAWQQQQQGPGSATVNGSGDAGADGGMDWELVDKAEMQQQGQGHSVVVVAEGCMGQASVNGAGDWLHAAPEPESYQPSVTAGAFEAIGPRDTMEDRHVVQPHWEQQLGAAQEVTLLAVFDGHRGQQAAEHCQARLPSVLQECIASSVSPQMALQHAFLKLEKEYHAIWEADCASRLLHGKATGQYPGCTAIVALLVGADLYVANAGDCRAVLSRGSEAVPLSRDHTAALEDERQRIHAAGGSVSFHHNSWRIGNCGLQVSRCIGDFDQKEHGVTAEPEVMHTRLGPSDTLLILGSDGIWDMISNEEAVGLVRDTVKDPMLCAKRLAMEALARGSNDNVTAAVLFLRPVSTLERVFGDGQQAFRATATVYGSRRGQAADMAHGASADELRETY